MPIDASTIDGWCRRNFGAAVVRRLFSTGHLAEVLAVELDDGRTMVLKVRPPSKRLKAVVAVQQHLYDAGVPCPRPLVGPLLLEGQAITAETYVAAARLPATAPPAAACAELLMRVIDAAPAASAAAELAPAPPWVGWDHPSEATWPTPDDLPLDLNLATPLEGVDGAAEAIRRRLRDDESPAMVGHVDWEARNMGWKDDQPVVVYDWDSLAIRTEPAIAGAAAAVFASTTGTAVAATIDQTEAFLEAYQLRRRTWRPQEVEIAWAAGLWVLLFNGKKESLGGGRGYLQHLEHELHHRMARAGC